ncbi:MAG: hypothetical protein J6I40_01010 [Mailhella sp.]|nr:hypothetical protein [Mailhella sp.]
MDSLLEEIKERIEKETRQPRELYSGLKQMGAAMFFSNTMSKEQVIMFCAAMIKLYLSLTEKKE